MINIRTGIQFAKFSLIGFLNTGIHYSIFYGLFQFGKMNYLCASATGYLVGLLNSFYMNRKWTFASKKNERRSEFIKFLAVNLVSMLVNLGSMKALVEILLIRPEIAQIFAIILSIGNNFLGNKFWTFREEGTKILARN